MGKEKDNDICYPIVNIVEDIHSQTDLGLIKIIPKVIKLHYVLYRNDLSGLDIDSALSSIQKGIDGAKGKINNK